MTERKLELGVDFNEVLKIDTIEVWGQVALKISYQDDKIFKRGEFKDYELDVFSTTSPCYVHTLSGFRLGLLGSSASRDSELMILSREQADKVAERVLKINHKYGAIALRTDEQIIGSYEPVKYGYLKDCCILLRDDSGLYHYDSNSAFEVLGATYYTERDIDRMISELHIEVNRRDSLSASEKVSSSLNAVNCKVRLPIPKYIISRLGGGK